MDPSLTSGLAIYAAVLATGQFLVSGWVSLLRRRQLMRDRGELQVVLSRVRLPDEDWSAATPLRLGLKVTNTGRRPLVVTRWGGDYRKPKPEGYTEFAAVARCLPAELQENYYLWEVLEGAAAQAALTTLSQECSSAWVEDSRGTRWRIPRRVLKRLPTSRMVVMTQPGDAEPS